MNHSLHTAIIDRAGRIAANIEGNQFAADQLASGPGADSDEQVIVPRVQLEARRRPHGHAGWQPVRHFSRQVAYWGCGVFFSFSA
jgi:hypothetical protein